jgi:hypothetical protein
MDEALALEERISDPIATQEIISTLINQLGLTADMLKPVISDYHERKARAKQKQGYDKLQAKAASLREQGKYDELEQLYAEELPSTPCKQCKHDNRAIHSRPLYSRPTTPQRRLSRQALLN